MVGGVFSLQETPMEPLKRPTIKETNRAHVRLFEYFTSLDKWLDFLKRYSVEFFSFGNRRNRDCAVRVVHLQSNELSNLGLDIPNHIIYHTYVSTAQSFWNEHFLSEMQTRTRSFEVGYPNVCKDEVCDL